MLCPTCILRCRINCRRLGSHHWSLRDRQLVHGAHHVSFDRMETYAPFHLSKLFHCIIYAAIFIGKSPEYEIYFPGSVFDAPCFSPVWMKSNWAYPENTTFETH